MESVKSIAKEMKSCTEESTDVKQDTQKKPVENDEKDIENEKKSKNVGKLLVPSSDLPTDVETDEAPSDVLQTPRAVFDHSEDKLTSLLDGLNISPTCTKSKVEDGPLKIKMKFEKPVIDEPSCDKAAKELSNLLTTLSVSQNRPKPTKDNDKATSILQKLDEALAEIGPTVEVNQNDEAKKKMKCRGFGDLFDTADAYNSTLQDLKGDLDVYFERQNSPSFGMIPTEVQSSRQGLTNSSSFTLPPFQEHFRPRNIPVSGPPTASYSRNQINLASASNPPAALGMYQTNQNISHMTNQSSGGAHDFVPFLPDPNGYIGAKRTKVDFDFEYRNPDTTYPSVNSYRHQEMSFPSPVQPPGSYSSVPPQPYTPPFCVPSTLPAPQPIPSSLYSTINSPTYSVYSDSHSSNIPSPSSSYTTDTSGMGSSTYSSNHFATSPRSQNSSSPTGCSQLSPDPSSSDSGFSASQFSPYNPPPYSNLGSPSSLTSSSFMTQNMTSSSQHTQGLNVTMNKNQPEVDFPSNLPTHSNTLDYTNDAGLDNTDEDGDCILHILLLVYGNLVNTGRNSQAIIFLNYVKAILLPHPVIKAKLNHQNYKLQTPLYLAVKYNLGPMVDLLIESGADVNLQGRGHEDWVKVPKSDAPLHVAVSMGEKGLNFVKSILKSQDANVNITNTEGETPLHVAAREHGMVFAETNRLVTRKNCIGVVQYLLSKGADMGAKEYKSGKTALMFAIESKDVLLVKTMLDRCDSRLRHGFLNESTNDMNTCMHLAFGLNKITESKHVELIRLLMKKGGEAEAENSSNQKAKDFAPNVYSKAVKLWK